MDASEKIDSVKSSLRAAVNQPPPPNLSTAKSVVRAVMPEIERLIRQRYSVTAIAVMLRHRGVRIAPGTLRNYIREFRREREQRRRR